MYYKGPPADIFFPGPSVLDISKKQDGEVIRVRFDVVASETELEETIIHTSDGGRTWVKDATHAGGPSEFGEPPLMYRMADYSVLERSRDGGNHWERPLLRVNGRSPEEFTRAQGGSDRAHLDAAVAAVHPRNPNTIYGCLEVLTELDKESGEVVLPREIPGLYVSYDAGDNWSVFSSELRGFAAEGYCTLGINPWNPNSMIAQGRTGLVMSRDGGKRWRAVGEQAELEKPAPLVGYAQALAKLKRKGVKPGREWPFDWTYLILTQVEFQRSSDDVVYLVTNKGLYKTENGARSWCLLDTRTSTLFEAGRLYVDPTNPRRIFVGTNTKVLVSDDAGCHFRTFFDTEEYTKNRRTDASR